MKKVRKHNVIHSIKTFLGRRKLKKQIEQSSFNCSSMEMASDEEWAQLNLTEKYEIERSKLDQLRLQLNIVSNV